MRRNDIMQVDSMIPIRGQAQSHPLAPVVTVMTWNLYLGAGINRVLGASSLADILSQVARTWSMVQATSFPERAVAIAGQIARAGPHLVGLQEVLLFHTQTPGDFLAGNPAPATDVAFDFLAILLSELEGRELTYRTVAISPGMDIELPSATGEDIRMTNREVILARGDVHVSNVREENFDMKVSLPVGGPEGLATQILRGWVSVDAMIAGRIIRFVNTHLEMEAFEEVQVGQANELIQELSDVTLPVVLLGDFNSAADGSTPGTCGNLINAGFVDVWTLANPGKNGFTGSQEENLLNATSKLNRRIDRVFTRNGFTAAKARVVGNEQADRTLSGLWPSDHAGVVALLRLRRQ